MTGRNLTTIILCGVAALLLLGGLFSPKWAGRSRRHRSFNVGLSAVQYCGRNKCKSRSFSEMHMRRSEDKLMAAAGKAVFWFGLLNVLGLIAVAVLIGLKNQASHIPARIVLFTVIFGLLLGIGYVVIIIASARGHIKPTPGMAFYLYQLGSIVGIVGGAFGWRRLAPAAAAPGQAAPALGQAAAAPGQAAAAPAQAQQTYPCQSCGAPLRYVAEHQRYYCDQCRKWA